MILTFTFDTGSVSLATIVAAIGAQKGYSATLRDGSTNPETPNQFAKRMVAEFIITMVRQQQQQDAVAAANINPITLT